MFADASRHLRNRLFRTGPVIFCRWSAADGPTTNHSTIMLSQTALSIIADIDAYMTQVGGANYQWYVGIASDVNKRLFGDHRVNKDTGMWIHHTAPTHEEAREIEA